MQTPTARFDPALAMKSAEAEVLGHQPDPRVKNAVQALGHYLRTVVYLADVEGGGYREIAAIMGTPAGTVALRLVRGRRQLRDLAHDQTPLGRSAPDTRRLHAGATGCYSPPRPGGRSACSRDVSGAGLGDGQCAQLVQPLLRRPLQGVGDLSPTPAEESSVIPRSTERWVYGRPHGGEH